MVCSSEDRMGFIITISISGTGRLLSSKFVTHSFMLRSPESSCKESKMSFETSVPQAGEIAFPANPNGKCSLHLNIVDQVDQSCVSPCLENFRLL